LIRGGSISRLCHTRFYSNSHTSNNSNNRNKFSDHGPGRTTRTAISPSPATRRATVCFDASPFVSLRAFTQKRLLCTLNMYNEELASLKPILAEIWDRWDHAVSFFPLFHLHPAFYLAPEANITSQRRAHYAEQGVKAGLSPNLRGLHPTPSLILRFSTTCNSTRSSTGHQLTSSGRGSTAHSSHAIPARFLQPPRRFLCRSACPQLRRPLTRI
jgi:hypothetical protein